MGDLPAEKRTAVVLVVDRLGAGFLGPMGNTWIDTPVLNELASRSLIAEQAWVDSPDLKVLYHSLWQGSHALWTDRARQQPSLGERLRQWQGESWLITDEPCLSEHPLHASFDHVEVVAADPLDPAHPDHTDAGVTETAMARLLSFAADTIAHQQPDLLWIHSRGMSAAWDAPLEFRDQFVEADDPPPPRSMDAPSFMLDEDFHHDDLQGWIWSYAGQVALLDMCLTVLFAALAEQQHPNMFILMGARGYPLGEHGALGPAGTGLYSELLHIPLMVQLPTATAVRTQRLIQPLHVYQSLCDWLQINGPGDESLLRLIDSPNAPWSQLAVTIQPDEAALVTSAWLARLTETGESELFLKPDDYWDINDVSDRCPIVVHAFEELFKKLATVQDRADWKKLFPLDEVLETRMD